MCGLGSAIVVCTHYSEPLVVWQRYFKAHTGSKQEWYRDDIHKVLLENFPVRGAFSQVYTGHELYRSLISALYFTCRRSFHPDLSVWLCDSLWLCLAVYGCVSI